MPHITGYNYDMQDGLPMSYFSYGAALSVVEVDCLTGDHVVSY